MDKTPVTILFLLVLMSLNAQTIMSPRPKDTSKMKLIDLGNIKIYYAFNAEDINKPETYDDLQRLEIGQNISKYYSYYVFNSDSLVTEWKKKHPTAESNPRRLGPGGKNPDNWSEYHFSEFFKDFTKNTFTEYARMPMHMDKYNSLYSEDIPMQNWKIQDEIQEVAGYQCQKATCHFRGRSYIAWFTMEIPINNGPWKFGGLPGLILKVYDNENFYTFECVKIEKHKQKHPIKKYNYKDYKIIDRKKLLEFQKEINENYFKVAGLRLMNGGVPPKPRIYHALELE